MADNNEGTPQHDAFFEQMMNRRPQNPSSRNPMISRDSSLPDRLEAQLQEMGQTTWGYVIYRTTYESDADWAEFLRRLRLWTEDSFDYYGGQDMLDLMTWTIFDDKALFDGVDADTIRDHFCEWAEPTRRIEQPPGAEMDKSPRYAYCVQVDAEALRSVLEAAPPLESDPNGTGWVRLIEKVWFPSDHDSDSETEMEEFEPIEGITERNVGWAKVPLDDVLSEYYVGCHGFVLYTRMYRRPPEMIM